MNSIETPSWRAYLAIACVGLTLRLILVLFRPGTLGVDEVIYDPLGWELASHGRYILDGAPATWPPGYPAFLAIVYLAFGHSTVAAGIMQSLLDVVAGIVLAGLGAQRFGRRVGFVILALWMFLPMRCIAPALLIQA